MANPTASAGEYMIWLEQENKRLKIEVDRLGRVLNDSHKAGELAIRTVEALKRGFDKAAEAAKEGASDEKPCN